MRAELVVWECPRCRRQLPQPKLVPVVYHEHHDGNVKCERPNDNGPQ